MRDRIKAVLLHDMGWSPQQIAQALFISDQAVREHIDDYKASSKLGPESGGSEEKLPKEQSALLEDETKRIIYNTYYECFKDFKTAILVFFTALNVLTEDSALSQSLRSRVRDKFRPVGTPAANF